MKHLILITLLLSACAAPSSQNQYSYQDVGQVSQVQMGIILKVREVAITGENRGNGSLAGGALGAVGASSIGNGSGNGLAIIGGAIVGAVLGNIVEQQLANSKGYEYTIKLDSKKIITVVQNQAVNDQVFHKGEKVMIQTGSGYQRVLGIE